MSKYGVFSGPYFPVFGLNTGKYGPEKTPYLDTFHAVKVNWKRKHAPYTVISLIKANLIEMTTKNTSSTESLNWNKRRCP